MLHRLTSSFVALIASPFLFRAAAFAQGYPPNESAARMTVPDGVEVTLFASEPMVRQPVCVEFDDRGRLWVIQYLQYPNPAGLSRVSVDRFSRTVYDKMPEPPPKATRPRLPRPRVRRHRARGARRRPLDRARRRAQGALMRASGAVASQRSRSTSARSAIAW